MIDPQTPASLHWLTTAATSFWLVGLAEMGDKTQLVCMTLAARHRHWPVLLGAVAAFILLNTLAVIFGAGVGQWIPQQIVSIVVAALFAVFGLKALFFPEEEEDENAPEVRGRNIFLATFVMLFLAEMGDKTQLAVVGLASTQSLAAVWSGATLALILTSALGVFVGCHVLRFIPMRRLHQLSGILFLLLAAHTLWEMFRT